MAQPTLKNAVCISPVPTNWYSSAVAYNSTGGYDIRSGFNEDSSLDNEEITNYFIDAP